MPTGSGGGGEAEGGGAQRPPLRHGRRAGACPRGRHFGRGGHRMGSVRTRMRSTSSKLRFHKAGRSAQARPAASSPSRRSTLSKPPPATPTRRDHRHRAGLHQPQVLRRRRCLRREPGERPGPELAEAAGARRETNRLQGSERPVLRGVHAAEPRRAATAHRVGRRDGVQRLVQPAVHGDGAVRRRRRRVGGVQASDREGRQVVQADVKEGAPFSVEFTLTGRRDERVKLKFSSQIQISCACKSTRGHFIEQLADNQFD